MTDFRFHDESFYDDDFLYFKINISNNSFDNIFVKCTAANMKIFDEKIFKYQDEDLLQRSQITLKYTNSLSVGILHHKISVEFVILVLNTNPNDKSITGSPLIIFC